MTTVLDHPDAGVARSDLIGSGPEPDPDVWDGVQRLLDDYAQLAARDAVVIAYTPDSRESAALVGLACEMRGIAPRFVPMAPLRDPGFRARLAAAAPLEDAPPGKLVILTFERDTMSHHGDIRAHFAGFDADRYRVIRAINAGRDLFATGLALGPAELSALNTSVLERLAAASRLRIRTPGGSDLRVRLDNERFRFISNRGVAQPRQFVIIPGGEVATYPAEIEGTLVADFALNVNMIYREDARLDRQPVTATVIDGRMTDFRCDNPTMSAFLARAFSRNNARRVGELGFGTNRAVASPCFDNSHLNERVPGVHLGFGQHNQTNAGTGYECDIHVDLCAKGGLIWFDDDPEPLDLETVVPSLRPHPLMARDEDVFSEEVQVEDCCGLLSSPSACAL